MKITAPDYYNRFSCIKGACRHSCCIGWEIDIDEASLQKFHAVEGQIGRRLRESIDESGETACFRLSEGERCPFLNQDGLCDLILELGADSLCDICADHPRYRSFFSDREEIGLGLCCEEAARIILMQDAQVHTVTLHDDGGCEENTADEDFLLELREGLISIAQDRSMPLQARIENLMRAADVELCPFDVKGWSRLLEGLERLDETWSARIEDLSIQTGKAVPAPSSALENAFEQLLVYLLWRHIPGALYDDDLRGRIAFCVRMWQMLRLMQAQNDPDGFIELCRMFSSEIEYSDENISAIIDYIHMENPRL